MSDAAIIVRGAREHNLRSVDLTLRHDQLILFSRFVWGCSQFLAACLEVSRQYSRQSTRQLVGHLQILESKHIHLVPDHY
jgi:excinuclease UvrABC ATPase subunit